MNFRTQEEQFAWLVGLLEGEGWFGMGTSYNARRSRYRYPQIQVEMTDLEPVALAAEMFGRALTSTQRPHRRTYRTTVLGASAEEWMRKMAPHLCPRRQGRIGEVLAARESRRFFLTPKPS